MVYPGRTFPLPSQNVSSSTGQSNRLNIFGPSSRVYGLQLPPYSLSYVSHLRPFFFLLATRWGFEGSKTLTPLVRQALLLPPDTAGIISFSRDHPFLQEHLGFLSLFNLVSGLRECYACAAPLNPMDDRFKYKCPPRHLDVLPATSLV